MISDDDVHDDRTQHEDAALDSSLRRLALQLVSSDEADDLVQETWLALLLAGTASIRHRASWMKRVARNLAARSLGAPSRRKDVEEQAAVEDVIDSHVEGFERSSVIELLRSTLATLREPYHSVLRQRYLMEMSIDEIATEQGCSRETVKSQLRRGLVEMRETLDRRTGGDRATWVGGVVVAFGFGSEELGGEVPGVLRAAARPHRVAVRVVAAAACVLLPLLAWTWTQRRESPAVAAPPVEVSASESGELVVVREDAPVTDETVRGEEDDAVVSEVATLERELVIELRTPEGLPAAFGHVDVIGIDGAIVARPRADADGIARVHLEPGQLMLPPRIPHPDGGVLISVREEEGAWSPSYRVPLPREGGHVVIPCAGPGQAIDGVVLDPFGDPVVDALVHLRREVTGTKQSAEGLSYSERGFSTRTDDGGSFRFEGLPFRLHHVSVHTQSWLPAEHAVGGEQQRLVLEVELEEGAVLVGRLLDPDGQPAAGVRVWDEPFRDKREVLTSEAVTDAMGEFVLTGLAAGSHRIFARDAGGRFASGLVEVDGELGGEWEGVLDHVEPLRVRVLDAEGEPIPRASVVAVAASTPPWGDMVVSDEEGWAVWPHVPDEPIALSVRRTLADRTQGPVLRGVRRGQADLVLRFEPERAGGVVVGTLLDHDGRPFERAVIIGCSARDLFQLTSDPESGVFRTDAREPGHYEVWAAVEGFGVLRIGEGELRPGEELDLRIVHAPRPVRVQVNNAPRSSCVVEIDGRCTLAPKPVAHFDGLSPELALFPGEYRLKQLGREVDPVAFVVREERGFLEVP